MLSPKTLLAIAVAIQIASVRSEHHHHPHQKKHQGNPDHVGTSKSGSLPDVLRDSRQNFLSCSSADGKNRLEVAYDLIASPSNKYVSVKNGADVRFSLARLFGEKSDAKVREHLDNNIINDITCNGQVKKEVNIRGQFQC
ncbi:hypothetical protein BCR37DRAFT_395164 [Protomyces lactucae-debilis]|uniref:Uncharacterized protein n=1 Tax=Protomyces lactucae-debilis TaxID=2754530 RepID=A0A1Y2EYA7_PROLT|nr:uncharacterized protein BCR37DRAFT_395164 [Protomyces lactucae-debilis]ORY76611.1 hypothetical protein BCR37DRAFT_395164 [Protomyces lactucae-debilis]